MSDDYHAGVERHWYDGPGGELLERIDAALREEGKDPNGITMDDLVPVDEFHIRGRDATAELAELAGIAPDEHVLDVGSGLGGPARFLAASRGCRVTGIDLTAEYCDVANALTQRVGLDERVRFQQANALELPFDDASFDIAWTQHISMNIADKRTFFSEMRRVVRPGGRVVIYDPIQGPGPAPEFPVPWSTDGDISFLIDAAATRRILDDLGLEITVWEDASQKSLDWFSANVRRTAAAARPAALGFQLLLPFAWPAMGANMVKNLASSALAVIQVVATRP